MRCAVYVCLLLAVGCGGADPTTLEDDGGTQGGPDVSVQDVTVTNEVTMPPVQIKCGPSMGCDAKTEVCCNHTSMSTWECVSDISQCQNFGDVPISCSSHDDCVAQGTPSYICCADLGPSNGTCNPATDVSCQATCDPSQAQDQVGCTSTDPCQSTLTPVCKVSTCTLPGYSICAQ
jgi:hypothetical protein